MGTQLSHTCPTGTGTSLPLTPYSNPRTGETGEKIVCLYAYLSTLWACFRSPLVENAVEPPSWVSTILRAKARGPAPAHSPTAWQGAHQWVNVLDGETDSWFLTCASINI